MANTFRSTEDVILFIPLPSFGSIAGPVLTTGYYNTAADLSLSIYNSSGATPYVSGVLFTAFPITPIPTKTISVTIISGFALITMDQAYYGAPGGTQYVNITHVPSGTDSGAAFYWGKTYDMVYNGSVKANNLPDSGALTSISSSTTATNTTLTGPGGTIYGLVEDALSAATKTYNFSQQLESLQFLRTMDTPSFVIPGFLDYDITTVNPPAVPTTVVASAATGATYAHTVTAILGNTAWRVVVTDPLTPADAGLFVLNFEVPSAISGSLGTRVPFYWGEGLPVETYRLMGNKVTTNTGVTPPVMTVYADDGVTPLYTRTLANGDGSAVNPAQILELSQYT